MPWKVSGAVEKRKAFVEEGLTGEWTMTELCARHAVSRQTGYNTVVRYQSAGWESMEERRLRPHATCRRRAPIPRACPNPSTAPP